MRIFLLAAVLFLIAAPGGAVREERLEEWTETARRISREFGTELRERLEDALAAGGPARAIAVCREAAPVIAERLSQKHGWQVGRTSLQVRNPANAPGHWEKEVLQSFDMQQALGPEDGAALELAEVVGDGQKRFRYMKAIPTRKLCLNCHGEDLSAEVTEKLRKLYPRDQATGYQVGDIRGAFTLSRPLE